MQDATVGTAAGRIVTIVHRHQIQFPAKHLALREDVHQLGALVGEILREQGGDPLFDLVEGDRLAAIQRREDDGADQGALAQRVAGRPPEVARDLVRAFSTWFRAVNLAERVHRIRRRREYFQTDSDRPQPSGVEAALATLRDQGMGLDELMSLVASLRIGPVLVAHSTESARRTQLRRNQRMAGVLLDKLNPNLDPRERRQLWTRIRTELTAGWQTEEHPRNRLTVADEREHAIFHLVEVLYRIVPAFYEEVGTAIEKLWHKPASELDLPNMLGFGSWVGGDMEGTPEVHAKTIRETLARQQQVIINAYFGECQRLAQSLSQSASRVAISTELARRIEEYRVLLPGARLDSQGRHDRMPYRSFFGQVAERLRHTYEGRPNRYESAAQFLDDLQLVTDSLRTNRGINAGYHQVHRLVLRARTFGFHLAMLDLRQHADVHHEVLAQGLDDPQWMQRPPAERYARLVALLERDIGPTGSFDALGKRVLAVFDAAMQARNRYGAEAIGYYVVSGVSGPDDVLAPLVLARWAGAYDKRSGAVSLDVAPLFESFESQRDCATIIGTVLDEPVYRQHLAARGRRQCVLVGYTHGCRDTGYLTTRLSAYDAQRSLAQAFAARSLEPIIFHARGGSLGRGGSRIDAMVESAPAGTAHGVLRITEQGESVSQGYSLRPNAMRTLERAFSALSLATAATVAGTGKSESVLAHQCATTLSVASRDTWRKLVMEDRDFHDYFRAVTPIDVIERMQIGSRTVWGPLSAGASPLQSIRTTPWVFAWSQSRCMMPGWYGAGTGLAAAVTAHGVQALRDSYASWPLFSQMLDELERMLARTDLQIARHYDQLATPVLRRFATQLQTEHALACEQLLQIKQASELLDGDRTLQRAIALRNPYVDPMNLMQVDLLRRWRASGREDEDLFQAVLASVNGIAQGLQTTG